MVLAEIIICKTNVFMQHTCLTVTPAGIFFANKMFGWQKFTIPHGNIVHGNHTFAM